MSLKIREWISLSSNLSKTNHVKMSCSGSEFIELYTTKGSVILRVDNDELSDEGVLYMPKLLMEDLGLNEDEEIFYILMNNIESQKGNILIEFIENPKCAESIIKKDFTHIFRRKFKSTPLNGGIRYHFSVDERRYIFKVIEPHTGYTMPVLNVTFKFKPESTINNSRISDTERILQSLRDVGTYLENMSSDEEDEEDYDTVRARANNILKNKSNGKSLTVNTSIKFDDIEIGGLTDEIQSFMRQIIIPRKFGLPASKGILLYGQPGCGKTLIAKTIAKKIGAKFCQYVNGPELQNKYIGESVANVRKLFDKAKEAKKRGEKDIYVIIFDEADAIVGKRESGLDCGTANRNDMVTQLLTEIQGLEELDNLLIIMLTNRKDVIDTAILRSGRVDIHIEIKPPTRDGRLEILKIVTKLYTKNLSPDINFEQLADVTSGYTGADLSSLIKKSASFAMMDSIDQITMEIKDDKPFMITNEHITKTMREMNIYVHKIEDINPELTILNENFIGEDVVSFYNDKIKTNLQYNNVDTSVQTFSINKNNIKTNTAISIMVARDGKNYFKTVRYVNLETLIRSGKSILQIYNEIRKDESSLMILDGIDIMMSGSALNDDIRQLKSILTSNNPIRNKICIFMTYISNNFIHQNGLNYYCNDCT